MQKRIDNNFFSRKKKEKMEQPNIQLYINGLSNKILKVKSLVMVYAVVISGHLTFLKRKARGATSFSFFSKYNLKKYNTCENKTLSFLLFHYYYGTSGANTAPPLNIQVNGV